MTDISNFTTMRSLLEGLTKAMNLINSDMEKHHEQTAYFSFFIGREMGLNETDLRLLIYSALLHDVGSIVNEETITIQEIEQQATRYAWIGATMLEDLPYFHDISNIIALCQSPWGLVHPLIKDNSDQLRWATLSSIIHTADIAASCLVPSEHVLNQTARICSIIEKGRGVEFMEEAVDAFLHFKDIELIWLDAMMNPNYLMYFTGSIRDVSLMETAQLTKLVSRIIDYRSSFTAMHSAGVAAVAKELARLCGMSPDDIIKMEIAGNLHDVGKLVVPREILEKPGKLTDEEFNIIKEHAYYTRYVLKDIIGFGEIANWAGFHHEKLDGHGYPFHLSSDQLDLGSRIMAVADIFSAITEVRPYRDGMKQEQAINVMKENVAKNAISKEIVDVLITNYDTIDKIRDTVSREEGKRYFMSFQKQP